MKMMMLQINRSRHEVRGSWREVVCFDAARRAEVEDAAASLSRAAGGLNLRLVDEDGAAFYLNENGAFRQRRDAEVP